MYYITPDGSYYEGANVAEGSIAVPQRHSEFHAWNNTEWVYSPALYRQSLKPLTARQVRLILNQYDLRASVESAVSASTQAVKDEWNHANEFYRNSPVLLGMAQALSITDAQLDTMFEEGALL